MVGVTSRSHGQSTNLRVLESVAVIAAECGRCVENLDRIDGQRFQSGKTDPSAKQIIRVRRNGKPAALVDYVADFACRFSLQVRKLRADAEKVAISGGHFHARENEEIIDRQSVQSH